MDESKGPYVVNPCDHVMASHLRFDGKTGRVDWRTPYGQHTLELLQLNDEASVKYRLATLKTVSLYTQEIESQELARKNLETLLRKGLVTKTQYDQEVASITQEVKVLRSIMSTFTGQLTIPPLRKQKGSVILFTP